MSNTVYYKAITIFVEINIFFRQINHQETKKIKIVDFITNSY